MPLNPKKPRSFLLQLLFFLLFPCSFGVISFLHYPSVHSTLMQNTGLALNPPKSAGGLHGSWQTWTRLIVSLCVFCGGSFRGPFAMQPLDLCAVRPGPAGGGDASHTEGRVTGPISLWSWKGVAGKRLVWTPDVDSQRKMDERTTTWSKRDEVWNEHEQWRMTSCLSNPSQWLSYSYYKPGQTESKRWVLSACYLLLEWE